SAPDPAPVRSWRPLRGRTPRFSRGDRADRLHDGRVGVFLVVVGDETQAKQRLALADLGGKEQERAFLSVADATIDLVELDVALTFARLAGFLLRSSRLRGRVTPRRPAIRRRTSSRKPRSFLTPVPSCMATPSDALLAEAVVTSSPWA